MSVFHRVDDIYSMPGPRFFRLAARLPAYEGVMRLRLMEEHERRNPTPSSGVAGKTNSGWRTMSLEQADAEARVAPSHMRGERREVRRGPGL